MAEGSTKKGTGLKKLKWPNAKKILGKSPSRSNSREAIVSSEESEVETEAENSPTGEKCLLSKFSVHTEHLRKIVR